jgi:hypothetical protein
MEEVYRELENFHQRLLLDGKTDMLQLAALCTTMGLTMYKTQLSPKDYDEMVETIMINKDNVKSYNSNAETMH